MSASQSAGKEPAGYGPTEVQISLSRSVCFGTCPAFEVQIFGDGTVKYLGLEFVVVKGSRETKISQQDIAKLVNQFLRLRFFELPATFDGAREIISYEGGRYDNGIRQLKPSDLPTTLLTLRLGNRSKTITLYADVPKELRDLSELVEDVAGTRPWTRK